MKRKFWKVGLLSAILLASLGLASNAGAASCEPTDENGLLQAIANVENCNKNKEGQYVISLPSKLTMASTISLNKSKKKILLKPKSAKDLAVLQFTLKSGYLGESFINLGSSGNKIERLKITCSKGGLAAIYIEGNSNIIEDVTIDCDSVGTGIFLSDLANNKILDNKIEGVKKNGWGININEEKQSQLGEDVLSELLCSNQITVTNAHKTNLELNNNGKDDYDDYHLKSGNPPVNKCDLWEIAQQCGEGASSIGDNNKCVCSGKYILDKNGKCTILCDQENYYIKDNICTLCAGEHKKVIDNNCKCNEESEEWPEGSGTCVEKCGEGKDMDTATGTCKCKEGTNMDENGNCISICLGEDEKYVNGVCVCKEGAARYMGLEGVPCIECGPNSTGISAGGECTCKNSYHVSLNGSCVSDSLGCSDDDPNAILENKKCVCKPQFAYTVVNGQPLCEQIPCTISGTEYYDPKGECLSPDAIACFEKGDEWNDESGKCIGAESGGDCTCNFTGGEPTFVQALMPFIAVLFGTGGMMVWRKSRKL